MLTEPVESCTDTHEDVQEFLPLRITQLCIYKAHVRGLDMMKGKW